ncbi:hypothetical protein ACVWY5_007008 [Bradyrhizobium sp. USDA 3256]
MFDVALIAEWRNLRTRPSLLGDCSYAFVCYGIRLGL